MTHFRTPFRRGAGWLAGLFLALPLSLSAQRENYSVGPPVQDNSVEAELASFEIAEGYEVSLFASEEHGIANPIVMRWGPRGRLWVLCSLVYPQIIPTEPPADRLFILEDTDDDGVADKTIVFAEGLDMPTGFALGNGGVYLGEGDDLVFLRDLDGDDRADTRELVLTGFGTGDTHQNINSFTWSPGGELLFCQGLHNFSRVETPWGIVRMDEHGVWRLRPKRAQLHAFRGCSGQNPWGLSFGHWGEAFAKSNGNEVSELLPVMVHTEHRHPPLDVGATRIKSMICEIIDSPALPADLQGNIVIAGYFAHVVDRLRMSTDGSGHRGELLAPLWRTDHQSFRPVDVQTGPDGALYIADWYNPIIGHYQASLRHPDRDKKHGRIWRLTAKGFATGKCEDLNALPTHTLLERLQTAPLKERERIRIALSNRNARNVLVDAAAWIRQLDRNDPRYEHHLYEALLLWEWNETINRSLLDLLLKAREPLARAYATRVVGRWHDRLDGAHALLEQAVADPHPRVRLEAVVAAAQLGSAEAMTIAARALDAPMDRFLEAALRQCTHALRPHWFAALQNGSLPMEDSRHLAFVLQQTTGQGAAKIARDLLAGGTIPFSSGAFAPLVTVLATQGAVDDLNWLLDLWWEGRASATPVLAALAESALLRGPRPTHKDLVTWLRTAIEKGQAEEQRHALRLAGAWKLAGLGRDLLRVSGNRASPMDTRVAAIEALAQLDKPDAARLRMLTELAGGPDEAAVGHAALAALSSLDPSAAARIATQHIKTSEPDTQLEPYIVPFLARKGGDLALAAALEASKPSGEIKARLRGVLGATGMHSPPLQEVLKPAPNANALGLLPYDENFVRTLAQEVRTAGDARRGSEVYHRDSLSCTMCHVIDFCGRPFGPELSAVGAGLPVEILIESVVWPRRQIKEGFLSTTITTKDGRIVSGHLKHEDKQRIVIEDAVTQARKTIAPKEVASRQDAGSIMPPGLAAQLTRAELRDLVRFLSERKGQNAEDNTSSPAPR